MGRKNELTARIAELTELLEELKSEREMLLANMECTDGKDAPSVRKKVKLMETDLKNLDVQEQKYEAELDAALQEYAELKAQAEQFDPVELHDTRQELRPDLEQAAVQQVKETCGDKYSNTTMVDSKRYGSISCSITPFKSKSTKVKRNADFSIEVNYST